MNMTALLKAWLVTNAGLKADATEDEFRKATLACLSDGKLSAAKFSELQTEERPADRVKSLLTGAITEALRPLSERLEKLEKGGATPPDPDDDQDQDDDDVDLKGDGDLENRITAMVTKALKSGRRSMRDSDDDQDDRDHKSDDDIETIDRPDVGAVKMVKMFTGDQYVASEGYSQPRVKAAVERYADQKSALCYGSDSRHKHLRGQRVYSGKDGHGLDTLSERDQAVNGAWFKMAVNSALRGRAVPKQWRMSEHDNQIVLWALHNCKFTGLIGYHEQQDEAACKIHNRKLQDHEIKGILDDSVSGGLEAAPIVFDDAVITTPLLFGELFPLVNLVNLPRGRRVEGFSIGNPTITSGTAEGTDIALFNTAGFIAAFDTTIYNAVGAIELGLDFQEDSPVGIANIVFQRYGDQFLAWLDDQIAGGDGTTEPRGVFNTSGGTTVNSDNAAAGPPTLSDYEGLLFGIQKQYRTAADRSRCVFITNEVTYRRTRGMKVDPAATSTDERRLMGMDHEGYVTLGHDHKINHNVANTHAAFVNLRYYRMYRRLGLQIRVERGGKDLALRNSELIVVRARFGGQMELGGAVAIQTDGQS